MAVVLVALRDDHGRSLQRVSPKMRPYHAGFLGVDSLIVLDEAHLVPPFEGLLEAIENGVTDFAPKGDEGQNHVPRMRLLSLSATGRDREKRIFQIEKTDLEHAIINKRLGAKKRLRARGYYAGK